MLFVALWVVFWGFSASVGYATFAAGAQTLAIAVGGVLVARAAWAPRLAGRRQLNVILASWAVVPALMAALLATAFGLPAGLAAVIGVGIGLLAGVGYARQRGRVHDLQTRFPLSVETLADAKRLRAATQVPASDPGCRATAGRCSG